MKPREWWIQLGTPDIIGESAKEMAECQNEHRIHCPIYHVIEKSAFDIVIKELDELREKVARENDCNSRFNDCVTENRALAAQLTYARANPSERELALVATLELIANGDKDGDHVTYFERYLDNGKIMPTTDDVARFALEKYKGEVGGE